MARNNKTIFHIIFLFLIFDTSSSHAQETFSYLLSVPVCTQPSGSQYCWREASKSVLSYYGFSTTLNQIATYGTNGHDITNFLSGQHNYSMEQCNFWQGLVWGLSFGLINICDNITVTENGIDLILNNFGQITSNYIETKYGWSTVVSDITFGRPMVIRIVVNGSNGHFLVIRGVSDNNGSSKKYYVMDSRPGYGYTTYTQASLESVWTHSLQLTFLPKSRSKILNSTLDLLR